MSESTASPGLPDPPDPPDPPGPPDPSEHPGVPRNVWAASATSFLMDVSSEMVFHVLPLFLANVLGARTAVIGLVEGAAEAIASLLKLGSGAVSDRLGRRKGLAVGGYALSALSRGGLLLATSWTGVAAARWIDRAGKGVRTAPRDALLADSITPGQRGRAFGLHRAADTAGAAVGVGIAIAVIGLAQGGSVLLEAEAFRTLVQWSLLPAGLAVLVLGLGARERRPTRRSVAGASGPGWRALGRPFALFLAASALFELGNFSDAFLVLRAQERGVSVVGILWMLLAFNVVYAALSQPAGALSDRIGRKRLVLAGWGVYAALYVGFALVESSRAVALLFVAYGAYYGLSYGTAKALVADLVPPALRGTAFGAHATVLGVMDLPASLLAGVLWQGLGDWPGLGAAAPFWMGAALASLAALVLALGMPEPGRGAGTQPGILAP